MRRSAPIAFRRAVWTLAICLLAIGMRVLPLRAQQPSTCMCSQSFAMVTLSLVDAKGAAVHDAVVRVRRMRSGKERDATADLPGVYTIADDMLRDSLSAGGEAFAITVRWRGRTQRTTVTVGTREPAKSSSTRSAQAPDCRCHVRRVSGPERLVLR